MKRYKITIWCAADQVEHGLDLVPDAVAYYESDVKPAFDAGGDLYDGDEVGDLIGAGFGTTVVVEEIDARSDS